MQHIPIIHHLTGAAILRYVLGVRFSNLALFGNKI